MQPQRPGRLPTSLKAFGHAIVDPLRMYRRTDDILLLQQSAALLDAWLAKYPTTVGSSRQKLIFTGWLSPHNGFRLTESWLRARNPEYYVSVRRSQRPELGWRGRLQRYGFRVTARGSTDLPPFEFGLRDPDRASPRPILTSNWHSALQYRTFAPIVASPPTPGQDERLPHGYLDAIQHGLDATPDPHTWFAVVAHEFAYELLELIDSPYGVTHAPLVAELLRTFPDNSRWLDRYTMIAEGAAGAYHSDLIPLRVVRARKDLAGAAEDLSIPEFTEHRSLVHWAAGDRPMPRPSTDWLRIADAIVQDGGVIRSGSNLIVYENAADPSLPFVAGQWQTVFGSAMNPEIALLHPRDSSKLEIAEGILLGGRNDENWYHWLLEYLPRVFTVPRHVADDIPFLISSRIPGTGKQALASLSDRPVIEIDALASQRVAILHVTAPIVQVRDTTRIPWRDGISMNPDPLLALRRVWSLSEAPTGEPRKVFLVRKSRHRGLVNGDALARVAARAGFEIVDPTSLTFANQLALFSTTGVLAGASGAVMANYLMMPRGSVAIALTSRGLADFVLPAAIAQVAGVNFYYVLGSVDRRVARLTRTEQMHAHFRVNPRLFEQALDALR